jgi:ligand-binding SRPBCC domain-containing protein
MPTIVLQTFIAAPPEFCFDAARDVETHCRTTAWTREKVVSGKTKGLLELGDSLTFSAVHFGIRQKLVGEITELERPRFFVDEMKRGAFASLKHRHEFEACDGGTLMHDIFEFASPFGIFGRLADTLFLKRYMTRFLRRKNRLFKQLLESQKYA